MSTPLRSLLAILSKKKNIISPSELNAASRDEFELHEIDNLEDAERWLASPLVGAWIVHESIGEKDAAALFASLDRHRNDVPLVYVAGDGGLLSGFGMVLPDVVISDPIDHADLAHKVAELLSRGLLTDVLMDVVKESMTKIVQQAFIPDAELKQAWFRAGHVPVFAVNATIPFCGPAVSGRISVSVGTEALKSIYSRLVPSAPRVSIRVLEDLVGEMSNQILGGLKRSTSAGGLDFAIGVPMMYTGSTCPVRFRTRSGSMLLRWGSAENSCEELAVGLSLDSVRKDYKATGEAEAETGELAFF